MSGREWEEILQIRKQLDAEDEARRDEEQRLRLQQQEERSRQQKQDERLARQQMEEKMHAVSLTASHVKRIFNDLAANDPGIIKFPLQEVNQSPIGENQNPSTTVSLRWGNKFKLTHEEERWVEQNEYRPTGFGGLFALTSPPESILQYDFYNISAHVGLDTTTIGWEKITSDSINTTPSSINAPVAKALRTVSHSYGVLTKGSDYWKDPLSKYGGGSSSSSDEGCCCNAGG